VESRHALAEVHQQIPRLLSNPGSAGVRGDSKKVHAAGGVLHEEQDMSRWPSSVSTQQKSVARTPCSWAARNWRARWGHHGEVRDRRRLT
jgi:hypothetical protein